MAAAANRSEAPEYFALKIGRLGRQHPDDNVFQSLSTGLVETSQIPKHSQSYANRPSQEPQELHSSPMTLITPVHYDLLITGYKPSKYVVLVR
jgi:hypothetical protein